MSHILAHKQHTMHESILQKKPWRQMLGIKKNRRGSKQYRMERKFLIMRCICIGLGKVAGA
jgi:hypothetical protein